MAEANQGATSIGAVALDQQPGAAAPQPSSGQSIASGKVDLTSIPEFRRVQSEYDRKLAAMQEELERFKAKQAQDEEARIAAADPDERAAYYQQQVSAMRQEQERQQIAARVVQTIQGAGLTLDDPRLAQALALGPTQQTLAEVNGAIARIALEEKRKIEESAAAAMAFQQQQSAAQQQVAVQRGAQAALVNAGVLTTSTAPSVVVAADPNAEKLAQYRARFAQVRNKGLPMDNPALRTLINDLRSEGWTLADIA